MSPSPELLSAETKKTVKSLSHAMSDSWSKSEKVVARAAYDKALAAAQQEHLERYRRFEAQSFSDLWNLESELGEWRRHIAGIFVYSYSRLHFAFVIFLNYGWITLEDLAGLSEDKIEFFRQATKEKTGELEE